jgi:hypothetical protein
VLLRSAPPHTRTYHTHRTLHPPPPRGGDTCTDVLVLSRAHSCSCCLLCISTRHKHPPLLLSNPKGKTTAAYKPNGTKNRKQGRGARFLIRFALFAARRNSAVLPGRRSACTKSQHIFFCACCRDTSTREWQSFQLFARFFR